MGIRKYWKQILISGIFFFIVSLISNSFMAGAFSALIVIKSFLSAIIFSILFNWFAVKWAAQRVKKISIQLENGEQILMEGGASHFKTGESVGGKLMLTDKRLIFKSHKFNIQNHEQSFPLLNIRTIGHGKTLGMIENLLILETRENQTHKFIVDLPTEWVKAAQNESSIV